MYPSLLLGFLSALFFSFTFVLNSEMGASGAYWLWSASLRFIFIFIILGIYLLSKRELGVIIHVIKKNIIQWFIWSFVGFGVFYSMLTYGSLFNESWLVASVWQVTIVAGALLTPFTAQSQPSSNMEPARQIPWLPILFSTLIIIGVVLVSLPSGRQTITGNTIVSIIPIIIAAFAYPLGNRKTMALSGHVLTPVQRVFAMTFCSMPLWMVMAGSALSRPIFSMKSSALYDDYIKVPSTQ